MDTYGMVECNKGVWCMKSGKGGEYLKSVKVWWCIQIQELCEPLSYDKHYQVVPESNQRLNIAAVSLILAAFLGVVSPLLDIKAMKSPSVIYTIS